MIVRGQAASERAVIAPACYILDIALARLITALSFDSNTGNYLLRKNVHSASRSLEKKSIIINCDFIGNCMSQ